MFADRDAMKVFSFPTNWRQERVVNDGSCQTEELTVVEAECQVAYTDDKEVQTMPEEEKKRRGGWTLNIYLKLLHVWMF